MEALPLSMRDQCYPLEEKLVSLLGAQVHLTLTDNRRVLVSVKHRGRTWVIRLHRMFVDADQGVLHSLGDYIVSRSHRARERLNAFVRDNQGKIRAVREGLRTRKTMLVTKGNYFSLIDSFDKLNAFYFKGSLECAITWGHQRKRHGKRMVRLGSYSLKNKIIRINPILDRSFVPLYVVENVIFHEMVHHYLGMQLIKGKTVSHHKSFRKMERDFPYWKEAKVWIEENLSCLSGIKR